MAAECADEHRSRAVLAAIVADPAYGPEALSHPATLFTLLCDYLPDSPREAGPLLAAAQVDVPHVLRAHVAHGLTGPTAINLAARRLAARTDLSDQECLWAVSEFALALGLATADRPLPPSAPRPARPGPSGGGPSRARGQRIWLAATLTVIAAAAAIGTAAAVMSQQDLAGRSQPRPRLSVSSPATPPARPSSPSSRTHGPGTPRSTPAARTSAASTPSTAPTNTASAPAVSPAQVAEQYVADVNKRDWLSLWDLGAGGVVLTYQPNPGPLTYSQMVATFEHTVWVSITSLTTAGDTVTIRTSALDSAGVTQHYQISLVIQGGRILSGSQYLLPS